MNVSNRDFRTPRRNAIDRLQRELEQKERNDDAQPDGFVHGMFYASRPENVEKGLPFARGYAWNPMPLTPEHLLSLLGQHVTTLTPRKAGAYGTMYEARGDWREMLTDVFAKPGYAKNIVLAKRWKEAPNVPRSLVAIKVQFVTTPKEEQAAIYEDIAHRQLSSATQVFRGRAIRGHEVIPTFVAGFTLFASNKVGRIRCTVMRMIEDATSLDKHVNEHGVSKDLYDRIEAIVAFVWLSGFAHADMHGGNMMVRRSDHEPFLIDFGFAVRIPKALLEKMREEIEASKFINDVFKSTYLEHVRDVLVSRFRGYPDWMNPDHKLLAELRRVGNLHVLRKRQRSSNNRQNSSRPPSWWTPQSVEDLPQGIKDWKRNLASKGKNPAKNP